MISILYVDDERDLLEIGKIFLEQSGEFRVDTSVSAQEALDTLPLRSYDAIISDYQMPVMDGIAFLKAVRERFGDVPFILFTGRGREEIVIQAINNGADFYLQKGGNPDAQFAELEHKIRQAVARRHAERSLRDSKRRLADIINFLPDATFAIDNKGTVIAWNRAMEKMTGTRASDVLGKGNYVYGRAFYREARPMLIDLVLTPDELFEKGKYSYTLRDTTNLTAETVRKQPDGTVAHFWGKACRLYDENGNLTGAIESIRDITELKKTEQELRKREEQYRSIVNDQAEMIARFTRDGTITFSNEAFRQYFVPLLALPGIDNQKLHDIMYGGHEAELNAFTDMLSPEAPIREIEHGITGQDGRTYWQVWSVRALFDRDGQPTEYQVVGRDITVQKRAEEEVIFKNILLSIEQEASPDGILIVDEQGKILSYNRKFIALWGIPNDLMASRLDEPVLQQVVGQCTDPDAFLSRIRYLYDHKDEKSFEEILLKDGRVFERFSTPMNGENGKYYGRVWYFRDITGRRRAEERLRESQESFHNLFTNMTEGAALHELVCSGDGTPTDYRILETNPAFGHHLGIDSDTVIGKTSREAYGVSDPPYLEIYARVARTGEPEIFETCFSPMGKFFSISAYCTGKDRFATIFEDITKRKRAEDALRESEAKFRGMAERIADIVLLVDREFLLTYVSPSLLAMLGRTAPDLLGKELPISNLPPSEQEKIHAAFLDNRALRTTGPLEITFSLPEGRSRILEFHGIPFQDKGVFQGVQLVAHDITDLRRAQDELRSAYEHLAASDEELRQNYDELRKNEQMLRASEEKFRALVEYSLDGILITDLTGILLFANRAAGLIVDVPDPNILAGTANMLQFVAGDCRDEALRDFEKILQGTDAYLVNYKLVTTTGRKIWVECIGKKIPFRDREAVLVSMRDVTERKNSEERVRESENRFATVFRSSPVALTLVSATDGVFIDVNDTFVRSTGYIRDQVIGKTSEQIGLISDAEDREKMISAFRNRQDIQGMEITCRNKTGEIRACLFSSRHILMQEKPYILSTIQDISDRKTAEVALRESERKFRRIADNAPDMIYRISVPDGKFEYVSPASIALTGYTPEEFHADPGLVRTLIHPAWKEYFRIQWAALPEKKLLPAYEYQIIDRAGEIHWLNQRNMPVLDEKGNLVAIEGIVTDITRQKNTERELRRNELRSLAVSENIGSWIWEIDPDGIYRYSSPAVVQILGYRADELVGKMHFYDLLDPSMKEDLTKAVFATMEGREPFRNFTNLNRHKNGTPVLIRTSGSPVFDEDGTFIGYCGVDEDITERTARESSFQALVRSMVGTTGINALRQIAENISSWLGTNGVMIGEIQPDKQTVNVTYMLLDGKEVAGFKYNLQGTPCENVTEKGFCLYEDNVRELFPEGRDLAELTIRGYIGTPLRNSAGQVFGILCAVSKNPIIPAPAMQETMDIIAVKAAAEIESMQMDRALRESEQKFRSLVEYALEGIFVLELGGTILFANNAAVRTLGFESPAELTGRNVMEFVAPESQQDAIKDFGEVARGHDAYLAQYKVITAHGKTIFLESIGKVINYEGKTADLVSIRDVTERKRAEDALSRSQHMLAEAMDMAHLVRWEYDVASELFTFDDRFYALYGTTAEREGGNLMPAEVYAREFVHPDDMHLVREEVQRDITTNDPDYQSRVEHRIIRRDGEVRHIVVRIGLTKDAEGRTIKTHGANQDITEIRMAEEAVRESEAKYRLLAENVHDVIWTATMDMHLTYISPSVMALRGCTVEEAMAESITDALTPSSLDVLMRGREIGLERLKRNEILPNSTMELEFYRKDGSTVWTETIISLAFDRSRRPVGVVGVIRDITRRRQVENALRESEEKYRSFVETSPGMIWEIDLQGKFRYISPMMKTTMGYEPKEMEGKSITDLITEESRARVMQDLTRHVTSEGPIPPFEVPARHRDGHEMVVEIRPSRVLDTGGNLVGLRGVANDVTERKKAEEALTRANRQLTLLGSVTRHDLLNKITIILGYLKIAEKKYSDPELAEHLRKIRSATTAIKSQMEFTRIYQNLGTHEPQWIDLATIMPSPYVPARISLDADIRGIMVLADPMLEKVFFNLLDNSTRHGQQVTKIRVSYQQSGNDLVIVWEDDGVGIAADLKEQIFERGFGENTGLGLFLVREILSLTGITIAETGRPGTGARFEIRIPQGKYRITTPQ